MNHEELQRDVAAIDDALERNRCEAERDALGRILDLMCEYEKQANNQQNETA